MDSRLDNLSQLLPKPGTEADWEPALDEILQIMKCTTGTLHGIDPETGLLKLIACRGIPPFLMPKIESIPVGKGIAGAAAERREAVQMCNLQTDTSGTARPDAKQTKVSGSLAIPILLGDELRGTVGVGMTEPYDFTDEESEVLWEISKLLADLV